MKVRVVFQNLQKSDFVKALVEERITSVLDKFPQNNQGKATVFVSMENSPRHPGPDLFGVKVLLDNSIRQTVVLSKKAASIFEATAGVADRLMDICHRQSDKLIHRRRVSQRKWKRLIHSPDQSEEEAS